MLAVLSSCRGAVRTGLDNVGAYAEVFRGKRVGIITNQTGYDSKGRFVADVFREMEGVRVTALFSPEHGQAGVKEAGEEVESTTHAVYGVPVYSLYGETKKPSREMLREVDVLVFDIQDVGARFYTYIYTMSLAMEAAGENGKRFVVLDRPNPITGLHVEGNVLEKELASFVGLHPIAVRYGMTVGELAGMFNGEGWAAKRVKAELTVVPLRGWRRGMWYDESGLRFIRPSPNIPDLETATVYPGMCLLEGTNVSEGRGTDRPFLQFGAPWIDSEGLSASLNGLGLAGLRFGPTSFTPVSSKYKGQRCHGVGISVTDREALRAYWSGIVIVNEIHRLYPDEFEWRASHFDRLCGTAKVREAIARGSSPARLRESWQAGLESFMRVREKYLLYRD